MKDGAPTNPKWVQDCYPFAFWPDGGVEFEGFPGRSDNHGGEGECGDEFQDGAGRVGAGGWDEGEVCGVGIEDVGVLCCVLGWIFKSMCR